MAGNDDRDLSRLPKWASAEIERLRGSVKYLEGQLAQGPDDSDTFADPYMNARPLGAGTRIRFIPAAGGAETTYYEAYIERDTLRVRCVGGSMLVMPGGSNTVSISVLDAFGDIVGGAL